MWDVDSHSVAVRLQAREVRTRSRRDMLLPAATATQRVLPTTLQSLPTGQSVPWVRSCSSPLHWSRRLQCEVRGMHTTSAQTVVTPTAIPQHHPCRQVGVH